MFTGIFSPAARHRKSFRGERKLRAAIEALERRQLLSVGVADPTFGVNGVSTATVTGPVTSYPVASVEQADGKVVVETIVDHDLLAARYNADGSIDTTFANNGVFRSAIAPGFDAFAGENAIAVAPNGDIVLLGTDNNLRTDVIDLTPGGQLNTAFNGTGVLSFDFTGGDGEVALMNQVAVDSQNRIVVAGFELQNNPSDPNYQESDFALVRIDPNGSFDSTFNVQDTPNSLPQQVGGVAGAAGEEVVSEGPGDIEFDSLAIGSDNQIVLTGGYFDPNLGNITNAIAWLNQDGTLDTNFNSTGTETDILLDGEPFVSQMHTAVDANDNLLIEENDSPSGIIVARYPENDPNGLPDATFGADGSVVINFAPNTDVNAQSIALSGDGQIAVGATINLNPLGNYTFEFGVAVLNGDGSLDSNFNPVSANNAPYNGDGILPGEATVYMGDTAEVNDTSIGFDPSGSVTLVGGEIPTAANTIDYIDVVRLNSAGTLDTSLNNSGTLVTAMTSTQDVQDESAINVPLIALEPNGNVVEAFTTNYFVAADQSFATYVMQFNSNGSLDSGFGTGGIVEVSEPGFELSGLAVGPNGDIYLSGSNPASSGPPSSNFDIVSLQPDGAANATFNGDGYLSLNPTTYSEAYSAANAIAVEPDGNIVVAGITAVPVIGYPNVYTMQTAVAELNPSGGLDASFNPTGGKPGVQILAPIGESAFTPPSGVIASAELLSEGEFEPNAVAIDPLGNIDLAGEIGGPNGSTIYMSAVRLTPSGALDATFNPDLPASSTNAEGLPAGAAEIDFGSGFGNARVAGMAVDSAGDVILAGYITNSNSGFFNVAVGELTSGGLADVAFNAVGANGANPGSDALPLGANNSDGVGVAIDSTGDIFVAGDSAVFEGSNYVYNANIVEFTGGEPNAAFGDGGDLASTFGSSTTNATGIAVDSENRVDLSGTTYVYGGGDEAVAARYLTTPIGTSVTSANVSASLDGTADLSATVAAAGFTVLTGSVNFTVTDADNDVLASVSAPVVDGAASTTIPLAGFNAGSYNIEASYIDSTGTYASSSGSSTLTIARATPTVTASASSTIYNAAAYPNSDVTASVTGLGNAAINDGSFTYAYYDSSHNALSSAPTSAGSYYVVAIWSGDTNYTSASSAMTPFTIGQATPSVSATASGATYNTLAYPNSDVSVSVTGVGNASITDGSISYAYYNASDVQIAGPPTSAGSYTVVATFSGDTNYTTASSAAAPFTIAQATPAVTASAINITANGLPYPSSDVTVSVTGVNNAVLSDGTISYTYDDSLGNQLSSAPTSAGSYSVVATYSGDTNYTSASSAKAAFTINPSVVQTATVTASAASIVYNGSAYPNSDVTVTVTGAGNTPITDGTFSYVYYNSEGNELPNSGAAPTNAGSYQVLVIWSGDANYPASASNMAPFTIAQATATVNLSGLAQTYDGAPLSASATTSPSGLAVSITYNGSPTAPTNAGSYAVVATISNPNYTGTASGTLVIAKASLVVTVINASRTYGAANPPFSSNVSGLASEDNITESYSTTATPASAVGNYTITVTLLDPNDRLPNYNVTLHNGTLTVIKANLTIAANPQTKVYGSANPTLTGTITGVENGDNITASYSTTATVHSGVGSYPITVTVNDPTGKLSNYNLTVANSTLTVTKAALTITANNATKTYGSANPALSVSYSGFVNGDSAASLTTAPTVTTTATTSSNVGVYPITASGAVDPNYSITYAAGSLQITPATLYVVVDPTISVKLVGQHDPNFTVVYIGFVLGQNASVLGGSLTITTALTTNSPIGIYAVVASGLTSTNYDIVYVNGYVLEL